MDCHPTLSNSGSSSESPHPTQASSKVSWALQKSRSQAYPCRNVSTWPKSTELLPVSRFGSIRTACRLQFKCCMISHSSNLGDLLPERKSCHDTHSRSGRWISKHLPGRKPSVITGRAPQDLTFYNLRDYSTAKTSRCFTGLRCYSWRATEKYACIRQGCHRHRKWRKSNFHKELPDE